MSDLHLSTILEQFLPAYQQDYPLSFHAKRVCEHITQCRTGALGSQLWQCNGCHFEKTVHCSCRDRHCPRCQGNRRQRWAEQQQHQLIPSRYFHVVFTLPHTLNGLAQTASDAVYHSLFQAVWQTVSQFAANRKRGGQAGMTAVLHTWGQSLTQHIHLHCLVPGGFLNQAQCWHSVEKDYLFPVKALSKVFRAKMLACLRAQGLELHNAKTLMQQDWGVHAKRCLCRPEAVIEYLGRYTQKGMLSESRLVAVDTQHVTFRYKDYRDNQHKVMQLSGVEFIRRYVSHILPKGFMRIRHFGFLANRCRAQKLAVIRKQAKITKHEERDDKLQSSEGSHPVGNWPCPQCHRGLLLPAAKRPLSVPPS
jgi:hypothetical protein